MPIDIVNAYIDGSAKDSQFSVIAPPTVIKAPTRFLKLRLSGSSDSGFPAARPSLYVASRNVMSCDGPIRSHTTLKLPVGSISYTGEPTISASHSMSASSMMWKSSFKTQPPLPRPVVMPTTHEMQPVQM